ncbi:uncharacterized protein LOC143362934 isoform X2 [Halictus rubicundus]|uniref:uncharacterized protein LOC143362934 isoform X2 n=1 Tax=Halictus rubicundus TaxID=77578 RepID=UPI004036A633
MNYNGNMPDWHQFNASQTNEVTAPTQNVNSGHLAFIPGVSPPTLNAHNLSSEGLSKHQNDTNFNPRNYQPFNNVSSGANISNNSPLASMAQMQNCISHYTSQNTRNPMLDNLNSSVDPRNTAIANINDDLGYRSNQVPFNGSMGHLTGPSCNLNASGPISGLTSRSNTGPGPGNSPRTGNGPAANPIYGSGPRHGSVSGFAPESGSGPVSMGPRNSNLGSVHAGKPGPPSYVPCKGLCCNSDPNINYQQWEKFGSYQNNAMYRDNVHPPNYQMENRHFGNNCNFRKDNLEGKETMGSVVPNAPVVDHRRNFTDYKYHKDHSLHRNYSTSTGMFTNYPMQNYNYSTEHQKYPYPMKEHPKTNNMSIANSGMMKHSEQNFIPQQKYNNKQFQYQNGNMLPKAVSTLNVGGNMVSSPQNAYFNSQFTRNIPTEMPHECQESTDNTAIASRPGCSFVHNSPPQHQSYQHKLAMQKFSMENHLRELSRIPGYQSHPKYKECIMRYRQLMKLQQSTNYQNPVQTSQVTTPVNTALPPINLQFDQNGMLINSNYLPDGIPKLPNAPPEEQSSEAMEKRIKDQAISVANEKRQRTQQSDHLMMPAQSEHVPSSCLESFQEQEQFLVQKDFNQNQLKVQTNDRHNFNTLNTDDNNKTMMQQKASKEFANKPELDVRQFLANWDETDDEENTSNLLATASNETTPVVVVSYENLDLSSKTPQNLEISRRNSFPSNNTTSDNDKGAKENITTRDCLTISYSSSEATADIIETSKRTIEEGVVKPGSIIHCISNGPDEIPTIHIVDNLEISNILGASNDQVIETLEKQNTISLFGEADGNNREGVILETTEQHDKDETRLLSTNYDDVAKESNIEDPNIPETIQTVTVSINSQELRVLSPSVKSNLDVAENLELKKQSSFVSEESHNPDDISLPDLPTSECTPISTTLNTPIHSDSEESSQNMEDLSISISANPIEVMQNSPVISFTQSPVKMEPYGQLNNEDKLGYKTSINSCHEQDTTITNFDFSADNSKVKSAELSKGKQAKSLGPIRKKVFSTESKECDIRVLDVCETLTSSAYELEVQQEEMDSEKNTEQESLSCIHEGKKKKKKRSMDSVKSTIQAGFDNEVSSSKTEDPTKKQKIQNLNVSVTTINPLLSEGDLNTKKRIKESVTCVDKCVDRNTNGDKVIKAQKKEVERLIQLKRSDMKRIARDGSISSQDDEQSVCHMTSQYKNYSIAVIKDTVILSDKKSHGTAEKCVNICCENPHELQFRTDCTKELSDEMKRKKYSENCKRSEAVQKDLDIADEDIRYTAGEARLLNEHNSNKDRLHRDKNIEERLQKDDNANKEVSLEQNVSSLVNPGSDDSATPVENSRLKFRKSFMKNANSEFGIQVTNVNLKFKDSDVGKELILGDKGQEHAKDALDSIKIEINVSCAERNLKRHEQNKRLLYEIDDSSCSNILDSHCRKRSTEQEILYANFDKVHKMIEKSPAVEVTTTNEKDKSTNDAATVVTDTTMSTALENSGKKLLEDNITCKDTLKASVKKSTNCSFNVDTIKTKSAISNTAIADANNKMLTKTNDKIEEEEDSSMNTEGDHRIRTQNQCSNLAENSSQAVTEAFKKSDEKKLDDISYMLNGSKKLLDIDFVEFNSKSLSSLNNLDFDLNQKEYKKCLGAKIGELDDNYMGMWKKPKIDHVFEDCDMFQSTSGYINPIFSNIDKMEDLHTVPVYTTKDGKISYSPNRRFTHHELMAEARRRETGCSARKSHYVNTWNSYYNSKFRKFHKKKRHHGFNDKNKHEYKDTKYLYQRKRNYSDDFCGKHHVKYKDYVHNIKNNNAVWPNRSKIDRVCSSSDSDEEIIGHHENIIDISDYRKIHAIENKTVAGVSKSHKRETITNNDPPSKETQLIQHNFLDSNKRPETVSGKDNINSHMMNNEFVDREIKENVKSDGSVSLLDKSSNCTSENLQSSKDKQSDERCKKSGISEHDSKTISNDVREEISIKENPIFEEKEDNKVCASESPLDTEEQQQENDLKEKNDQSSLSKDKDTSEDHTETCTVLETNQDEEATCEASKTKHHASDEMSRNHLSEKNDQSSLSKDTDTFEDHTETCTVLETNQDEEAMCEAYKTKHHTSDEMSKNHLSEKNDQSSLSKDKDAFGDHTETCTVLETNQDEEATCETYKTKHHASDEMSKNHLSEKNDQSSLSNNKDTFEDHTKTCTVSETNQDEEAMCEAYKTTHHASDEMSKNHLSEKNDQSLLSKDKDTFGHHTETCTVLETNQDEEATCETYKTKHHASDELSSNILICGISKETLTEVIDVLPKSSNEELNDKTDFRQNLKLVQTSNTNEKHEDNITENAEESIISMRDEKDDSKNNVSKVNNVICIKQEEYESQLMHIVTTNSESSKYSVETVKTNEAVNTDLSTEVDNLTTKQYIESTDISETTTHVDKDYATNKSVVPLGNNEGDTMKSIKDVLTEDAMVCFDNSEDHSNASYPEKLQNENEANLTRESSPESEMPDLCMYDETKNSLPETCVKKKSDNEEYKQEEEEKCELPSFDSCRNLETDSSPSNTNVKMIPKLVIKKTDASISKTEYLLDSTQSENLSDKYNTKLLPDLRPKIPKMIIVKSRSRSATPTTEILEKNKSENSRSFSSEHNDTSMDVDNSDSESYTLKYKNYESKVPKVKIKLDNISSKDLKLYMKRKATKKNVSRSKVKRIKIPENKNSSIKYGTEDSSEAEISGSDDDEQILQELSTSEAEKIPKLKLKKQDEDVILSLERTKENDTNTSKTLIKKSKKSKEEGVKHFNDDEIRKKYPQYITAKIPKVIIKRTQVGAEFKCEISKNKKFSNIDASKWQPKVKLERLKILDHIAKDTKEPELLLSDKLHVEHDINKNDSDYNDRVKLCRSNSVSNLSTIKYKQRRFSDPDYTKIDVKSTLTDIDLKDEEDDENRNLKRKGKKTSLSQSKRVNHSLINESENKVKEIDKYENVIEESFENHLIEDDNDSFVEKSEYSSFGTKPTISSVEDKYLSSDILRSRNFGDNDNSIIKVDSSDESQTTIELLPASPDSSDNDNESKNREFESISRMHLDDAIPTQLELELDLIDLRNTQHSDALTPKINMLNYANIDKYEHASHSKNECVDTGTSKTFFNDLQCSPQSAFNKNKVQSPEKKSNDYFYCNDLLVKEVLAAKETLKKCLSQSENENKEKRVSRPKTVAEKKQGLSFSFQNLEKSCYKSEDKKFTSTGKKEYKSVQQLDIKEIEENHTKQDEHSSKGQQLKWKESQEETSYNCPTASTCRSTSVPELATISLKATKKFSQIAISKESLNIETNTLNPSNNLDTLQDTSKLTEKKSEKKTINSIQDQKTNDSSSETKTKEDNMPLLVPEFALNFDSNSDRDSSRSPPVITNQEESDNAVENTKDTKNKVITPIEKIEENIKHSYKDCEMTIGDIITQLAYHEKATIKHRRYCNLCERWFPTTSRHRRHLAGYQHRYMELTQRKSIHTLFILFTGKPCPRLLPANVIRTDCSIGELTPLQIAVQDVSNYVESTEDLKTIE